jgi:CubicO group peptidase (beta-lactamase class C family)
VAKSVVSILIGMAIKEGAIGSVAEPITRYLPELKGSAWEGVNLRDLLQHTSGVAWNENYAAMHTAQQTFRAEGIYGQAIAINPIEKLVMVQWSTWKEAETPASLYDEQVLFCNALAHTLARPN